MFRPTCLDKFMLVYSMRLLLVSSHFVAGFHWSYETLRHPPLFKYLSYHFVYLERRENQGSPPVLARNQTQTDEPWHQAPLLVTLIFTGPAWCAFQKKTLYMYKCSFETLYSFNWGMFSTEVKSSTSAWSKKNQTLQVETNIDLSLKWKL